MSDKIILRLKSGREFAFDCESFSVKTWEANGKLSSFMYEGGIGECPIYFDPNEVEAIAVVYKGGDTE